MILVCSINYFLLQKLAFRPAILYLCTNQRITTNFILLTMAIFIKLYESQIGPESNRGRWYARPVSQGEIGIKQLAENIQNNTSYKSGEVQGLLIELIAEMKEALQNGQTVNLEGFGRFHLKVVSKPAESREAFRVDRNIKDVKCQFVPAGHRNADGTISQVFAEGVKIKQWKD